MQLRIGALTADRDLEMKLTQARGFLEKGFRVKLVVRFGHWQRANGEARLRSVTEEVKKWSHVTAPQVRPAAVTDCDLCWLADRCLQASKQTQLRACRVQDEIMPAWLPSPAGLQANEKMARNTFLIYLTPGLGMTTPGQPAAPAALPPEPPRPQAARVSA